MIELCAKLSIQICLLVGRSGKRRIEGACSEVACGAALVLPTKRELNSLELSIW